MGFDENSRRKKRRRRTLFWFLVVEFTLLAACLAVVLLLTMQQKEDPLLDQTMTFEYYSEEPVTERTVFVPKPEIDEQLLTINEWSRPGKKIDELENIVIHYLGNPKTTAQENHDYFESLKELQNVSMSANYVIGLEGEIIHCVPDDEIAYASNRANSYSISIENCHTDDTGRLNKATYESLVHLSAYLVEIYGLETDQIIRHYDVTGKDCPKYFVEHEEAWERFLSDVDTYREACRKVQETEPRVETEYTGLSDFLKENTSDQGE